MNESFEKRLFLAFLISSIFILISYYFLPKPALQVKQQAGQVAEEKKSSFLIEDFIFKTNVIAMTNRIQTENMAIDIDTFGGRIVDTYINGKWNQTKKPIKLYWQTNPFKSGDLFFGPLELQNIYSIRPFYDVEEKTERKKEAKKQRHTHPPPPPTPPSTPPATPTATPNATPNATLNQSTESPACCNSQARPKGTRISSKRACSTKPSRAPGARYST